MQVIKIPKKEGLIDRKTGKILNRKLRVAAYARVSTLGIEQLNSYESQKKYYYDKINVKKEESSNSILEKNKINMEDKNVILDFVNTKRFFSYERDENGKLNKVFRNGLRIRVECGIR